MSDRPSDRAIAESFWEFVGATQAVPCGHESRERGASTYNWRRHVEQTILDRARSLDAAAPAQAGEWVTEQFLVRLRAFADAEYFRGCGIAREDACLGWEQKAKAGKYGEVEHDAHRRLERAMGAHFGIYEAIRVALSAAPPAPQPATAGQPPTDYGDSGSKSVVPTAEHWRRAVSDFVLEQGVHLAANDWTHIEQRAVALAREEGK